MLDTFRRIGNVQLKSRRSPGRWKASLGNSLAPALFRRAKGLAVGRIGMGSVGGGSAAIFGFDSRCQFFSPTYCYAHLADSFARLHFVAPSLLCAPPNDPHAGRTGGRVSLRPAQGFGSPAPLRSAWCSMRYLWTHLASVRLRASAQRFSRSGFASRTCGREAALVRVVAALSCTIGAAAQRLSDIHWCKMAGWTFVFESENICKNRAQASLSCAGTIV